IRCDLVTGVQTCALPICTQPLLQQMSLAAQQLPAHAFWPMAHREAHWFAVAAQPPLPQHAGAAALQYVWSPQSLAPAGSSLHVEIGRASCRASEDTGQYE